MTAFTCTHPGCHTTLDIPALSGALAERLSRAWTCDDHAPDTPAVPTPPVPTVLSSWAHRVPSDILRVYGHPPRLDDLPTSIEVLPSLRRLVDAWPERWTHPSSGQPVNALVLSGTTGTLKTTIAYAMTLDLIRASARPDLHHQRVHIASEGDLLGDQVNDRGWTTPAHPAKTVRGADIVIVDDVGTGYFSRPDHRTSAWWSLLDVLVRRQTLLILTTNITTERGLWDHIGGAAFSRLVHLWGLSASRDFTPPTSDNPADRGYWPSHIGLFITPTLDDYRMKIAAGETP